jgi:hypothetical protein
MSPYNKTVVAVVGALVVLLNAAGVEVAEDISESVIALVTAALVYLVPNE